VLGALVLGLAGCGGDAGDSAETQVVATTTIVADLARNVAGNRAEVVGLLAANGDPHDYEPKPSDAEAIAEADLVLKSGSDLDLWADEVIEAAGSDTTVVELIDSVDAIEGGHDDAHAEEEGGEHAAEEEEAHAAEETDPHWWQNPLNAVAAAETIQEALSEADPDGADQYAANADDFVAELERLDAGIASCVETIPPGDRKLVTTHDALGYFADRYGLEVIGAAVPALTTQAQPSAGETSDLVEQIESEDVRAIFPEAGLEPALEDAISRETGAEVGGELWADTLGPEGSAGATYLEAMASNAETLAGGLTGRPGACEIPPQD
jgi:zinc/manganese transport system substrate-binding protein